MKGNNFIFASCAISVISALSSCSVFTSSINGRLVDAEAYADGTTTGIADAKVFLYNVEADWTKDYDAWVVDNSVLPDDSSKSSYSYFQSTATDINGAFTFNGFVWDTLFPAFGKTADRRAIYLLFYHPDYELHKNPVPLFVVSDVTNVLDLIKIPDRFDSGRISGKVLNWKTGNPLQGVTANVYVPDTWGFDASGNVVDAVYKNAPSYTALTNADGVWTLDIKFPMMPSRAADKKKTIVLISYVLTGWRMEDTVDSSVNGVGVVILDRDLNLDGRLPVDGDYADEYILFTVPESTDTSATTLVPNRIVQRWLFSAPVRGRVFDQDLPVAIPPTYTAIDGKEVVFTLFGSKVYSTFSEVQTQSGSEISGNFDLGTVEWQISNITTAADKKTGKVPVTVAVTGSTIVSGGIANLFPDTIASMNLKVTTP